VTRPDGRDVHHGVRFGCAERLTSVTLTSPRVTRHPDMHDRAATAPVREGSFMHLASRLTLPRLDSARRLLVLGVSLLLAAALLPALPGGSAQAARARAIAVPAAFFGMHDTDPTSWPQAAVGSVRLWDTGVTWKDIETSAGVYDWTRLDAQVAAARAHRAEITLVLGQTPLFHVAGTARQSCALAPSAFCSRLATGSANAPREAAWTAYVSAVAARYAGQIRNLQVWNEANVVGYWNGGAAAMARLTYLTRVAVGARMRILAPAMVARSGGVFFATYWKQKVAGRSMNSLVDAVSLSLYPSATGRPEDAMTLLAASRRVLKRAKVTKPVWNTEVNYGLSAGGVGSRPRAIGVDRQAAYVARTYLLNAANRVQRTFWYSWDVTPIANTHLTTNGVVAKPGRAYGVVRSWLVGHRLQGCAKARTGTYTCAIAGKGRVYWNPARTVTVRVARNVSSRTSLYGVKARLKGGSALKVDYRPVLVR